MLLDKINTKKAVVGVIGLGYVGLPLAILAAKKGYHVIGLQRDVKKIQSLKKAITSIDTVHKDELREVVDSGVFIPEILTNEVLKKIDIFLVCVPTPIHHNKKPDLSAMNEVAKVLVHADMTNKLLINESTVAPGTTRHIFEKLSENGLLACSPERVDPGNKTKIVSAISKVVGGRDIESTKAAAQFYRSILDSKVVEVSSLEAAEMTKMLENTYRAVNIALVNEFAMLSQVLGLDIVEIIRAASTKWSFQAHFPGIGVGGHCIPVDPYYLVDLARELHIDFSVVKTALQRNDNMPAYVYSQFMNYYKKDMSVLVYGLSYKKDVADLRESPSMVFCQLLKDQNIPFAVYDPIIPEHDVKKLGYSIGEKRPVDIFVIATDHSVLETEKDMFISKDTIVIDGRNVLKHKEGRTVVGVGRKFE